MGKLKQQSYDAIVVGSGPGGATVARELSNQNQCVLLLERGNNNPITGGKFQAVMNMGVPFKHILLTNNMVSMVRAITTGGSSIYYYATCFEPPLDMLKTYGVDIAAEVQEAKAELPNKPLEDDLLGPMAKRIMTSACDLGYDWQKLPKFIFQERCRPQCWRCNYGCPYGAKWNARMFVEEGFRKGLVLENCAKVQRVIVENKKAVGVEFRKNLQTHQVFAPNIILAGGGIGSPMILRSSGIKRAGYNFFFDPLIAVFGQVDDIEGGCEVPMSTGVHIKDEGYMMTDMTLPASLYCGFASEVGRLDRLGIHKKTLTIMIKAKDSLGGSLTEGGGLRKKLMESDYQALRRGYERARKILSNAGAKHIFKSWYVAAHPGGTIKINDLVDANLQTEYENLYVCDCSVIPESFGLPPTLTLIGLAKRLAKHLKD